MGKQETRTSDKNKVLFRGQDPLYAVSISPDGSRYLDAGGAVTMSPASFFLDEVKAKDVKFIGNASIRIWNTQKNEVLALLSGHKRPIVAALFITVEKVATLSFDGELRITCLRTQQVIRTGRKSMGRSEALIYIPKKSLLVTSMGDETIRGWDAETGQERFVLQGHLRNHGVWSVAAHPTKVLLASGGGYGLVILWDILNERSTQSITLDSAPWGLAWHPDGLRLYIATEGRLLAVDTKSGKTLNEFDSETHNLWAVAVSPDGTLVAAGGGGTIRGAASSRKNSIIHVWNVKTEKKVIRLAGHSDMVRSLVFKSNAKELLSASWDGTLRQWAIT